MQDNEGPTHPSMWKVHKVEVLQFPPIICTLSHPFHSFSIPILFMEFDHPLIKAPSPFQRNQSIHY